MVLSGRVMRNSSESTSVPSSSHTRSSRVPAVIPFLVSLLLQQTLKDASLPFAALQLLAPPVRLVSAALWKVLKQRDVMQYGVVEEFVTSACETVPGLLTLRHQGKLALGLRARFPIDYGPKFDQELEKLLWEFLIRLDQLLPVPNLAQVGIRTHICPVVLVYIYVGVKMICLQTVSWLSDAPPVLEECAQAATQPQLLKILLQHQTCLGHLESAESGSEEEEISENASGEKRINRNQRISETEEDGSRTVQNSGCNRGLLNSYISKLGFEKLHLPEDPSLCSVFASCLSSSPRVVIQKLSVSSASTRLSGGGGKSFYKEQQKQKRKSSTGKQTPESPGLDDKE
ncbi:hypothetical protein XENOCAPTIV_030353 [Xenoophorus captivus]|uniref:TERF1-interacting nuclear factor 2 N-terminal domain-containing protein n=1 Tax=Xenoophorus captivus TaxID=1517983 RepID=A0ABV0QVG7_9TELE